MDDNRGQSSPVRICWQKSIEPLGRAFSRRAPFWLYHRLLVNNLNEIHDLKFKACRWDRIEKGTASKKIMILPCDGVKNMLRESRENASPLDVWMMQRRGEEILQAWPFPLVSTRSAFPKEQILLFAILYGNSDIVNGGLEQFFRKLHWRFCAGKQRTGLELIVLLRLPEVLRQAMALFGTPYPREQTTREEMLPSLPLNSLPCQTFTLNRFRRTTTSIQPVKSCWQKRMKDDTSR